jgi:hypothetical protein
MFIQSGTFEGSIPPKFSESAEQNAGGATYFEQAAEILLGVKGNRTPLDLPTRTRAK